MNYRHYILFRRVIVALVQRDRYYIQLQYQNVCFKPPMTECTVVHREVSAKRSKGNNVW
jgi:hypothetical protein